MNTEKTFIGFNKNGKEILIYKKDENTYINLLSKDNSEYPVDDIDLVSLKPYSKVMKTFKHKTQKGIVKKYEHDRFKILDTGKIKIGYICSISDVKSLNNYLINKLYKTLFIEHFLRYEDLYDGSRYFTKINTATKDGNLCAEVKDSNILFATQHCAGNRYITKKKVIEIAHKMR